MLIDGKEWRLVPVDSLVRLASIIDPPPVEHDGKTMVFKNPNAADLLTRISAEVRAMLAAAPTPPEAWHERYREGVSAGYKLGREAGRQEAAALTPPAATAAPSDDELLDIYREACEHAERCNQGHSYGRAQALRAVLQRYGQAPAASVKPVAEVVLIDPDVEGVWPKREPYKDVDFSQAWIDAAAIGTKLYDRPQPAAQAAPGMPEGWADAYTAFVGAFDTPQMRRLINDEYANDARRRLRDLNDAFTTQGASRG